MAGQARRPYMQRPYTPGDLAALGQPAWDGRLGEGKDALTLARQGHICAVWGVVHGANNDELWMVVHERLTLPERSTVARRVARWTRAFLQTSYRVQAHCEMTDYEGQRFVAWLGFARVGTVTLQGVAYVRYSYQGRP